MEVQRPEWRFREAASISGLAGTAQGGTERVRPHPRARVVWQERKGTFRRMAEGVANGRTGSEVCVGGRT